MYNKLNDMIIEHLKEEEKKAKEEERLSILLRLLDDINETNAYCKQKQKQIENSARLDKLIERLEKIAA